MKYFLIQGTHNENIPTGDEFLKVLKEHQEYMKAYKTEGRLLLAGINAQGGGGFVIMKCESYEEAKRIDDNDPFVLYGMQTSVITEFNKVHSTPGAGEWFED